MLYEGKTKTRRRGEAPEAGQPPQTRTKRKATTDHPTKGRERGEVTGIDGLGIENNYRTPG